MLFFFQCNGPPRALHVLTHTFPTRLSSDPVAIGCAPGKDDLFGLRYGKIVILADADSDGLHIATLLAALFRKHFPALVATGNIFVAMPPLFRVDVGKQVFYALDEEEKRLLLEKIEREKGDRKKGMSGAVNVTRFKGLVAMNPDRKRVVEGKRGSVSVELGGH